LCSLHSAHANLTIKLQLYTLQPFKIFVDDIWEFIHRTSGVDIDEKHLYVPMTTDEKWSAGFAFIDCETRSRERRLVDALSDSCT
jgi:hypothetical protein